MRPLIDRLRETAPFSEDGGLLMEAADVIALVQSLAVETANVTRNSPEKYDKGYAAAIQFLGGLVESIIAGRPAGELVLRRAR